MRVLRILREVVPVPRTVSMDSQRDNRYQTYPSLLFGIKNARITTGTAIPTAAMVIYLIQLAHAHLGTKYAN